jgi:hypothetical protein
MLANLKVFYDIDYLHNVNHYRKTCDSKGMTMYLWGGGLILVQKLYYWHGLPCRNPSIFFSHSKKSESLNLTLLV